MKTVILVGLALLAAPVDAMAQDGVAAATLPNNFDRSAAVSAVPAQAAVLPDDRAEPALRAFIDQAASGTIDTTVLSDELAAAVTAQAAQVTPLIQSLGAVQVVTFVGKENGTDLFSILFDKADTEWIIGFNADGRIGALLFRPAGTE
ncbi:hypothetical protein [uncultured Brevundimonas sp.]|uniref:hypothetical protein n=1 Tax=uncultured Brevundimonas sp. TaxID=213418 RepID=UPI0030EB7ACA|tara:strand:- start:73673 stop:74116 length:444 start_codon:yes stop_codon:yes gene_type:complete